MAPTSAQRVILVVNCGSSSVKHALFTADASPSRIADGVLDATGAGAVAALLRWIEAHVGDTPIAAVGHRIVHGGPRYHDAQLMTTAVRSDLEQLVSFAPNHLPDELAVVDALGRAAPGIPQVACFDTAFHQHMPHVARRLPIPAEYHERGVCRYGFHGLSYAFLLEELEHLAGQQAARGRVVLAHLGNGSSLAAARDGVGVDTTMAFTPLSGVVMSTRAGDLDPGVVTYLARTESMAADQLEDMLSKRSGLLGISGTTGDMQQLLERESTDASARSAVESYVYSVAKAIGALTAVLRGLDTLVFAGGIGEHAAVVRARICDAFAFVGLDLDADANRRHAPVISTPMSRVTVRVIPTNEELMIARATCRVLASS